MNDIPPFRAQPGRDAEAFSRGDRPVPPSPGRPEAPAGWLRRRARLLVALVLVAVACFGLARQQFSLTSEHAVISAAIIPLRTPIGGLVTELNLRAGRDVPRGLTAARIENDRIDRRRLLDATAERDRAADAIRALDAEIETLDAIAAAMSRRAEDRRQEERRILAAATKDLRRRIEDAAAPAPRSLVLHTGVGATLYLEQRLDDIALRRAELRRQLATRQAAFTRAEARIAEETARLAQEGQSALQAGDGWLAWRITATRGQRVSAEETLAELVDCRAVFLLATVGQRDVPHVQRGQAVRVLLDGEEAPRHGIVEGLLPEGMLSEGGRLAVLPTRPQGGSQVAQVAIEQPATGTPCPIGRTGRVVFDLRLPGR